MNSWCACSDVSLLVGSSKKTPLLTLFIAKKPTSSDSEIKHIILGGNTSSVGVQSRTVEQTDYCHFQSSLWSLCARTLKDEGGCPVHSIHCSFQKLRILFDLLFLSSYKFTSLRHCLSGGEALNPEVMAKWKIQTGLDIYEGYGQTETVRLH